MTTTPARAAFLIAAPVAFSGPLWLHPMVGDWEGLRDATTRFQAVHVGMVLTFCVIAVGMYHLLDGLRGRAASVARFALFRSPRSTSRTWRSRASRSARSARSSTASRPPSATRWRPA